MFIQVADPQESGGRRMTRRQNEDQKPPYRRSHGYEVETPSSGAFLDDQRSVEWAEVGREDDEPRPDIDSPTTCSISVSKHSSQTIEESQDRLTDVRGSKNIIDRH